MPFTTAGSSKVKAEATFKMPSRASTPRSRTMKRTLQDAFAEGSAKDSEVLKRLGTQKHEHAIGELELKCCKLENKAMEKQHQREQHKFHDEPEPAMMQSQNQPSFDGLGLMAELNGATLQSEMPLTPFSI